jgi:hypothetical protein
MNVDPIKLSALYDPIANKILVGSGPFQCGTVTSSGSGTCTPGGVTNPGVGQSYTLTRFGNGFPPNSPPFDVYFRSAGNLALWIWTQNNGDFTHDFLNFVFVESCFNLPALPIGTTTGCGHFQQGIGGMNGGGSPVGLNQISEVNRFVGISWVAPFDWATAPPLGIGALAPVLNEGSITLNPSSISGCTSAYPIGGYDC